MNAFESMTHARVVDCFEAEGTICFLVKKGDLGKAIGKGGSVISNARKKLGKRIAVYEDFDNDREFIEKACGTTKASPNIEENKINVDIPRSQREEISGKDIRLLKELFKRKFKVDNVNFSFN